MKTKNQLIDELLKDLQEACYAYDPYESNIPLYDSGMKSQLTAYVESFLQEIDKNKRKRKTAQLKKQLLQMKNRCIR